MFQGSNLIRWSTLKKLNNAPTGGLVTLLFYIFLFPVQHHQPDSTTDDFVQLNRKLFNHEPCIQSSPLDSSTTSLPETLPVKENTNTSQSEPEVELLKLTINDENYEMGLRRNNQIYFPWTWIEPFFDVYGNINSENDTFKFYNGN